MNAKSATVTDIRGMPLAHHDALIERLHDRAETLAGRLAASEAKVEELENELVETERQAKEAVGAQSALIRSVATLGAQVDGMTAKTNVLEIKLGIEQKDHERTQKELAELKATISAREDAEKKAAEELAAREAADALAKKAKEAATKKGRFWTKVKWAASGVSGVALAILGFAASAYGKAHGLW